MKARDLLIVQYCCEYGGFRTLPLHTCVDLAHEDIEKDGSHSWVAVGYAVDENKAYIEMKAYKEKLKKKKSLDSKANDSGVLL